MMGFKIALFCRPHQVPGGDLTAFIEVARLADQAGLYGFHFGDHVLMSENTGAYPYGPFAHGSQSPWLEPIVALAAVAPVTKQIRLSTGVLLTPLRPATLLAKTIATLDVLSGGRAEPGIGTGWQREEYDAQGLDWDKRYKLFDDGIRACRALWGEQPVTFRSDSTSFENVWSLPRPVQERIPLLYGVAGTPRHIRRIAELGDGWCPVGVDHAALRDGVDRLHAAFAEAGRDPSTLIVRQGLGPKLRDDGHIDVDATRAEAARWLEAGATVLATVLPADLGSMSDAERFIGQLGEVAKA